VRLHGTAERCEESSKGSEGRKARKLSMIEQGAEHIR
jgi:hypothetical protein